MSSNTDRLRVVVANPLAEQLCRLIEKREPRIELVRDQSLYPPMRHPADFSGDPSFSRTAAQQRAVRRDGRLGRGALRHPRRRPGRAEANRGRQPGAALGAHHGRRRRWPGQGRRPRARRSCAGSSSPPRPGCTAARSPSSPCSACWPAPRICRGCSHSSATRRWSGRWQMRQVSEMTVLVVGLGGIGAEVARRLSGLGATVVGTSRHHRPVAARRPVDPHRPDRRRPCPTWTRSC